MASVNKKYVADNKKLMAEWNWNKNNELGLNPEELTCGSNKKAWWICSKEHEWKATIYNRSNGKNCPYCSNQKVLIGYNDLATTNPKLAKQWHPTKNGKLTPQDVTASSGKKVWWICNKEHEWKAIIASRNRGNNCPYCAKEKQTSFAEQAIYFYCKKITTAINRYIEFGKEIDIYLPEYNVGIEYNGMYWHKHKEQHDKDKIVYFAHKGIRIITVKESNKNFIDGDVIEHNCNDINTINFVIENIFNLIGIELCEIDINKDMPKILEQYIESEKENSIAIKCPKSIKEWNYEKNGKFLPTMISYGSNKKMWWKCEKCGYEWESQVGHYAHGHWCPECSKKKMSKQVRCIETGIVYYSQTEASRQTGINSSSISNACTGKYKTAGGYHWEFVED